jgi:hypothetical protein
MNKPELITELLKRVNKYLEDNILEQFEGFVITEETHDKVEIICNDKDNNCDNECEFNFNWFN